MLARHSRPSCALTDGGTVQSRTMLVERVYELTWLVRRLVVTITDCRPAASPSAFYRLDLGDF